MNRTQAKGKPWIIVAFFTLFMAVYSFNLMIFAACAFDTMQTYGIEQVHLTTLSSVVSLTGLLGGFILGPIIDKKGSRGVVTVGLILAAVLFGIRTFVVSYIVALLLTFVASFFFGVCQVDSPKILNTWYTKENVGTAVSVQASGVGIGSTLAFAIGTPLGLRTCLIIVTVLAAVLTIVWLFVGHDGPIEVRRTPLPKNATFTVYKSRFVWCISIAYACCMSATTVINTYIINAFASTGRVTPEQASLMGTLLSLSLFIGGYLSTFVMHKLKRFNPVMAVSVLGGAAGYLLCWFLPTGPMTWVFLVLAGLIMGGGLILCISRIPLVPLTGEVPYELVGTASGALHVIKGVIAFAVPLVIANLFSTNFSAVFISVAVLCLIAFITGCLLVPEVGAAGKLFKQSESSKNRS